jgi:hypothetical protein
VVLRQIRELDELEQIEAIERRYCDEFGAEPLNVSHWDPSVQFTRPLSRDLHLDVGADPVNYIYSYDIDATGVLERLGFDSSKGCLITTGGTTSMLCVANWLAALRQSAIHLVRPFYFPIFHQVELLGMAVHEPAMTRTESGYRLPRSELAGSSDPIWITQPVYSAGVPLEKDDIAWLESYLRDGGTLIADECFAPAGEELCRRLGHYPGFVGIYTPHKTICTNAFKFSAVVFDRAHQVFFDQWADVLCGGLTASTTIALRHFLSDNFGEYDRAFRGAVHRSIVAVRELAKLCPSGELDREVIGHFATFYLPRMAASLGKDDEFLWQLTSQTAAVLIPGTRNHFDASIGFCFRINLALDSPQFRGALGRVFQFLEDYRVPEPSVRASLGPLG